MPAPFGFCGQYRSTRGKCSRPQVAATCVRMGTVFMVQFDTLKTSPVAWKRITAAEDFYLSRDPLHIKMGDSFLGKGCKTCYRSKRRPQGSYVPTAQYIGTFSQRSRGGIPSSSALPTMLSRLLRSSSVDYMFGKNANLDERVQSEE